MPINFIVKALNKAQFYPLLKLNDKDLAKHDAKWITVDVNPAFPCRVSLIDAKVGERVLALPFCHHDVNSPYRSSGPIFIRENAQTTELKMNQLPSVLNDRLLSIRAYDTNAMMIHAAVLNNNEISSKISRLFKNETIKYIHIHNAKPGCFACAVFRS